MKEAPGAVRPFDADDEPMSAEAKKALRLAKKRIRDAVKASDKSKQ